MCGGMSPILGKGKWSSEVLKIYWIPLFKKGGLIHQCTISTFTLYTKCKYIAHLHIFHRPKMQCVHMGGLTILPLSCLREKGKNWTQSMFLFIISGVGNRMNMYKVNKMHGMSVSSNNVCEECPLSLVKGNGRQVFENKLNSFKEGGLVHPYTISTFTLYTSTNFICLVVNVYICVG